MRLPSYATAEGVSEYLQHRVLRDLAWLLATPDLIELPGPIPNAGQPTRVELGLNARETEWLSQLAPVVAALKEKPATRMGHYHEQLWHLLLSHAPNTRLMAHNVRITYKRKTLGELDMVYRTCNNPAPIHLEVAIKFYLGLPDGPGALSSQSRWIGPGGLDSLALKCSHLRDHQLPISNTPIALDTLAHWLAPRDVDQSTVLEHLTQRLAMPGVLFYPWHAPLPPPEGATAAHRRGKWCYISDWPALATDNDTALQMAWLEKPHWLAPPRADMFHPATELIPMIRQLVQQRGPQQVMLYSPKEARSEERSLERLFIVPDAWPRQIPLPPTRPPAQ